MVQLLLLSLKIHLVLSSSQVQLVLETLLMFMLLFQRPVRLGFLRLQDTVS